MRVIKIILKVTLALLISTLLIMLLWNWLIPDIFKGPQITFIQAGGLLILAKLLFSGLGHRFGRHHSRRRYYDWKKCRDKTEEKEEENKL